ncbi:tRNA (adenosine(37)-N6)-dimethylallyltransferase MiaA [Tuberibacillus sp. Marseille-P3662]|uniref:tRNA (adenosine(37)-N6)-dimethylallyltransferase MiaA n=1 Tax=Tuberibacillus sp. Marseille-P3662 TaxID=1965358 RepID=UPI000A1CDB6F|nr:tRNA (adenosine(37)-N6)-dimethylallyltransferase MiaA [Tuberibacillus sp. Marseille-P3662]
MNEPLLAIVGPTAVGKTDISIALAQALNGEIINGDAMQVYRDLSIGTAKIKNNEKQGISHHLLDILSPLDSYTAADFQHDVRRLIPDISGRGHLPIIVGGTGLYVKAATHRYQFTNDHQDPAYRKKLEDIALDQGNQVLHDRLNAVDPKSAEAIHPNNVRRVVRALEIYKQTGIPKSQQESDQQLQPLYDLTVIGLSLPRDILYERINHRVDQMMEHGLLEEARWLYDLEHHGTQSAQGIGYKELFKYFDGEWNLETAIQKIKKHTRQFAKRQFTWFEHQMDVMWFDMTDALDDFSKKADEIVEFVAGMYQHRSN